MLCWRVEGSNDLINWVTLDSRNHKMQHDVIRTLCEPELTTTWGVPESQHAFSHFRIVHTELNAGLTNHICLQNLEVYGVPSNEEAWRL